MSDIPGSFHYTSSSEQGRYWEHIYTRQFPAHYSLDDVFAFFSRAENLEKLTPARLSFRILSPLPLTMQKGARIEYIIRLSGLPMRWHTLIADWQPPHSFIDIQTRGPYRLWWHEHSFRQTDAGVLMQDRVRFDPGFGWLGTIVQKIYIHRMIQKIFHYRNEQLQAIFPAQLQADTLSD